jgi:REP element-mobilizing transposase RayT
MSKNNTELNLKIRSNAVYKIYYHIIFVIRYRYECITPEILQRLEEELTRLCILA